MNLLLDPLKLHDLPAKHTLQLVKQWQVGQILNAVVSKSETNSVTLRLAGTEINIKNTAQLKTNQTVQLEVIKTHPEPLLTIRNDSPVKNTPSTLPVLLKRYLPSKIEPSNTASIFRQIQPDLFKVFDTKHAQQIIAKLFPEQHKLIDKDSLKSLLVNSGLHFESNIHKALTIDMTKPVLAVQHHDLKGQLLAIKQQIQQNTVTAADRSNNITNEIKIPERSRIEQTLTANKLIQALDRLISTITVNQLNLVSSESTGITNWSLFLPFIFAKQPHLLHLDIEKRAHDANNDEKDSWSISLSLNLEQLGPVEIHIKQTMAKVNAVIYVKKTAAYSVLQTKLKQLSNQDHNGLIYEIKYVHGSAPVQQKPVSIPTGLLADKV